MNTAKGVRAVFDQLYATYGPQDWWPGDSPFEIMVGAVLTQNTAWRNVERAIAKLFAHQALSAESILAADPGQLADWLRPSGYFNVKARRLRNLCHWYREQGGFEALAAQPTPVLRAGLLSVNGIGPETADDILLYAFERPVFVIDAYTRRLFSRLGLLEATLDYEAMRHAFEQALVEGAVAPVPLFNEYHALIVMHAKEACRPRPRCASCCLRLACPSRQQGG